MAINATTALGDRIENNGWILLLEYVIGFIIFMIFADWLYRRHLFIATYIMIFLTITAAPFTVYPPGQHTAFGLTKFCIICPFWIYFSMAKIAYFSKERTPNAKYAQLLWKFSRRAWCIDLNTEFSETTAITKVFSIFLYFLLQLNILAAAVQNIVDGYHFNFIAGLILMATLAVPQQWLYPQESIEIDFDHYQHKKRYDFNDILWKIPIGWIILFTSWDLCLISGYNITSLFINSFHLFPNLVLCSYYKDFDLWFQYRATLIFLVLILLAPYPEELIHLVLSSEYLINSVFGEGDDKKGSDDFQLFVQIWSAINMISAIIYSFYWIHCIYRKRTTFKNDAVDYDDVISDDSGRDALLEENRNFKGVIGRDVL